MTNNQSEDIAAIAAGLTVAQRAAFDLVEHVPFRFSSQWHKTVGGQLEAMGLIVRIWPLCAVLAPLGEALRAHLNKTDGEKG